MQILLLTLVVTLVLCSIKFQEILASTVVSDGRVSPTTKGLLVQALALPFSVAIVLNQYFGQSEQFVLFFFFHFTKIEWLKNTTILNWLL